MDIFREMFIVYYIKTRHAFELFAMVGTWD